MGAEATVFAMLTALSNFGAAVSSYFGATLLVIFNVSSDNYHNLKWLLIVKTCCRMCTLFLIHSLVPEGSPNDSAEEKSVTDDEQWGVGLDDEGDNGSRHFLSNFCGLKTTAQDMLDCSRGTGDTLSVTDERTINPLYSRSSAPMAESSHSGVEMRHRKVGAAEDGNTAAGRVKIDTSRYFQYISPHENLTTQNV